MSPTQFRNVRVQMGYSATKLASVLGVSPGSIYHWENGRTQLPTMAILALTHLTTQPRPEVPRLRDPGKYLPGARFGRLVIDGTHSAKPKNGSGIQELRATVVCDCGTIKDIRASSLATVRQCCGRCKASKNPMPPNAPAPNAAEILAAALEEPSAPRPPRQRPAPRPAPPATYPSRRFSSPPPAPRSLSPEEIAAQEEADALLSMTPAEMGARELAVLRAAAKAEADALQAAFDDLDGEDEDLDATLNDAVNSYTSDEDDDLEEGL